MNEDILLLFRMLVSYNVLLLISFLYIPNLSVLLIRENRVTVGIRQSFLGNAFTEHFDNEIWFACIRRTLYSNISTRINQLKNCVLN